MTDTTPQDALAAGADAYRRRHPQKPAGEDDTKRGTLDAGRTAYQRRRGHTGIGQQ